MKILFSADHHIKLGQIKFPRMAERFLMLGDRLNDIFHNHNCDLHIIGGDLFDHSDPSSEEVELLEKFMSRLDHIGMVFTGNHELITKTISCLYHYAGVINKVTSGSGSNY